MSNFRLVLRSGPTPGKVFPIEKHELFLGRDLANDIVINDPEVSRRHVRFFMQGANVVVEDLGSTNGTSINGQRLVGPYILRPGEVITLGEHISLVFEVAVDVDATVAARPPVQAPPPIQQPVYQAPPPRQQPVYTPPPPPQSYVGQVPAAPPPPVAEPPKKGMSPAVIILLVILAIIACFCFAAGIYLYFAPAEVWCSLPIIPAMMGFNCP